MTNNVEERVRELNRLVGRMVSQGPDKQALELAELASELAKRHLPPESPAYGVSLSNLGMVHRFRRDYEKALPALEKALAVLRVAWGQEHPSFPRVLENLADTYEAAGRPAAAQRCLSEVAEVIRDSRGEKSLEFADALDNLARLNRSQGSHPEALRQAIHAMEIRRDLLGENSPQFASSLNNIAMLYKDSGEYRKAEALYLETLEITRRCMAPGHPEYATRLNNLAELYRKMGRYAEAEPLYREAANIFRKSIGIQPQTATCLSNWASLCAAVGRHTQAAALLQETFDIQSKALGSDDPQSLDSLHTLANAYAEVGNYRAAEPLLRRVVEHYRSAFGSDNTHITRATGDLGLLYSEMGRYVEAEALLREALAATRAVAGEQSEAYAVNLSNLAMLCRSVGRYDAAEGMYRQALDTLSTLFGKDSRRLEAVLNGLGGLYRDKGDYRRAERMYRRVLESREQLPLVEDPDYGRWLNNLGGLYEDMGNFEQALSCYRRALDIWQRTLGHESPLVASALSNLTGLLFVMGRRLEAEEFCRRATEILRAAGGNDGPSYAVALNNLACILAARGSGEEALRMQEMSLEIRRAAFGANHPQVANGLCNVAALHMESGRFCDAAPILRQALEILRNALGDRHPHLTHVAILLAEVCQATGQTTESLELMKWTAAIGDQMLGQVFSISTEKERTAYLRVLWYQLHSCLSLVLNQFLSSQSAVTWALNLVLRRKAIVLESLAIQRDEILAGRNPDLRERISEFREVRTQLARELMSGAGGAEENLYQEHLAALRARQELLEAELVRQIPEMTMEQVSRVDAESIAAALPADSVLVEFFLILDSRLTSPRQPRVRRYIAFLLPAGEPQSARMIDLGEADVIDGLISDFRREIAAHSRTTRQGSELEPPRTGSRGGLKLMQAVFAPLVDSLQGRTRLLIAPDGELATVPFEVLPNGDGARVIDCYKISYLATGRDVLRFGAGPSSQVTAPLVVADPDFDLCWQGSVPRGPGRIGDSIAPQDLTRANLRFGRLEGTRREGQSIAEMLGVLPLLDAEALKSGIRQLHSPRILHVATHGFFLRNHDVAALPSPTWDFRFLEGKAGETTRVFGTADLRNPLLRSGLALAGANTWLAGKDPPTAAEDGLLTAEDVTGLDLIETQLVVLSACETGLGDVRIGEGVYGLRRAFSLAGVQTLLMTLWKIPDQQTQELMVDFYKRLLAGEGRADALRNAQLAIKEKCPEPLYWGAFVCQGDPGPLRLDSGRSPASGNKDRILEEVSRPMQYPSASHRQARDTAELAKVRCNEGNAFAAVGRYREALVCYDSALELDPGDAFSWSNKGIALGELGCHEEEIACYDQALALDPQFAMAWFNKGAALHHAGTLDKAVDCYEHAVHCDPSYVKAWAQRGIALGLLERHQEALECFDRATVLDPISADAWLNKGTAFLKLEQLSDALRCFTEAEKLGHPKGASAVQFCREKLEGTAQATEPANVSEAARLVEAGLAFAAAQSWQEAIASYDHALQLDGGNIFGWLNKGVALDALGRPIEAIQCWDAVLRLKPSLLEAWFNKGAVLARLGSYDEALTCYDRAIEARPQDGAAWFNKGLVLFKSLQRYRDALVCFEQAQKRDVKRASPLLHLCREMLGER